MADFRYRVNSGPWILVENVTLPYTIIGTLGSDIVDIQPIGTSALNLGTDLIIPSSGIVNVMGQPNSIIPVTITPMGGTIEVTSA